MSKNNLFTKETKGEKYIYIIVAVLSIILGILVKLDVISIVKEEEVTKKDDAILAMVLIGLGIVSLINGIHGIMKERKYKKESVYYKLIEDLENNKIKNCLFDEDLNLEYLTIEKNKNDIGFIYTVDNGSFYCHIDEQHIIYSFEYNDEYIDGMTDEEMENLPLWEIGGIHSSLEYSKEQVYKEYIELIKDNIEK